MASYVELMNAAGQAEAAGDVDAAKQLISAARLIKQHVPMEDFTPPRADDPTPVGGPQPDRFGDTFSAAVEGPWEMTKAYGKGLIDMDQSDSPTLEKLPDWMPYKRGVARTADAGMTALGALGTLYGMGAGLAGEVAGGSPTNEKKLARDLMMMGEMAVPELAGVSGTVLAGGRAAGAASKVEKPPTPGQSTARAADELGITPSLGMQGKTGGVLAATLEKPIFSASNIANDAARVVGEVEAVLNKNVFRLGVPSTAEGAGTALQRGLTKFVERFNKASAEKYAKVDELIPPTTRISLDNTVKSFDDAMAVFQGNPELASKIGLDKWQKVIEEARTGGASWGAIKQFRTEVGASIGKMTGTMTDQSEARLKALYATLTDDMAAAAKAAGPDAEKAWNAATAHYKRGAERIEGHLDKLITAESPERAFSAFMNAARDGASGADLTRLRKIRNSVQSVSKDDWGEITSTIVERLGRARAGAQDETGKLFSPASFLTNWNKLTPEARAVLLGPEVNAELTKLAKVTRAIKDANLERNMSNTGTVNANTLALAGLLTEPVTTLAVGGTTMLSSKAMTSTAFLRALNKHARGDSGQIKAMANGNGPFNHDAKVVLNLVAAKSATEPTPEPLRAVQ